MSSRVARLLALAYRALLVVYPPAFRRRYAAEMTSVFEDECRAMGRRRLGAARLLGRSVTEILSNATAEWIAVLRATRRASRPSTPRSGNPGMAFFSDLRFAVRTLRRSPGFVLAFVLTLGLGIGANTAIFSVLRGVVLRPLPYQDADRLVYLKQSMASRGRDNILFSFTEIADLREQATTLGSIAGYGNNEFTVLLGDAPHRAGAGLVDHEYFRLLGLRARHGRTLMPGDDAPDAAPVAVLTHQYFVRAFGRDSTVVGSTFRLGSGKTATIVGVLEPIAHYSGTRDIYFNYAVDDHYVGASMQDERAHRMTDVYARLAPDVTLETARAELDAIMARLQAAYPETYAPDDGHGFTAVSWLDEITRNARQTLWFLLGAAGFVLLIACANVAGLMLTRQVRRAGELEIRAALGASRARMRSQVLAESLALSAAGSVLGIIVARLSLDSLIAYAARYTVRTDAIRIDALVLGVTIALAVGVAVLAGWLPSLRAGTGALGPGRRSTGSVARRRLQRGLVVVQIAASFVLLVGAGLLGRTLMAVLRVDVGFETEHVLTMEMHEPSAPLGRTNRQGGDRSEEARRFTATLFDRLEAHPDIRAAAVTGNAPLRATAAASADYLVDGHADPRPLAPVAWTVVSDDYFEAIDLPIVRGRGFEPTDRADAPAVLVVTESTARDLFPGEDPIGQRVARRLGSAWSGWHTVIGVVPDTRAQGIETGEVHGFFQPMLQGPPFPPSVLLVRTTGEPALVTDFVVATIRELSPTRPVEHVQTLAQIRDDVVAPRRLNAVLVGSFAGLALVIALVGVAGVLAFSVSQRANEFGVRMTLGADAGRVLSMVLVEGARLAALGLGLGFAGAVALAGAMRGLLFDVRPHDPLTYVAVIACLTVAALTAAYIPARRAAGVDPVEALRVL